MVKESGRHSYLLRFVLLVVIVANAFLILNFTVSKNNIGLAPPVGGSTTQPTSQPKSVAEVGCVEQKILTHTIYKNDTECTATRPPCSSIGSNCYPTSCSDWCSSGVDNVAPGSASPVGCLELVINRIMEQGERCNYYMTGEGYAQRCNLNLECPGLSCTKGGCEMYQPTFVTYTDVINQGPPQEVDTFGGCNCRYVAKMEIKDFYYCKFACNSMTK